MRMSDWSSDVCSSDLQILPLAVAVLAHRHVERRVAAHRHAAVHADDLVLGHAEVGRDLRDIFGRQIAVLERFEIVLHPAEVEEQLILRRGGAHFHQAPRPQDEFLRSEEHTSELQSLMRTSYAVLRWKKKKSHSSLLYHSLPLSYQTPSHHNTSVYLSSQPT